MRWVLWRIFGGLGVREGTDRVVGMGGDYDGGKGRYRECPANPKRVACIGYFVAAAVEAGPEERG